MNVPELELETFKKMIKNSLEDYRKAEQEYYNTGDRKAYDLKTEKFAEICASFVESVLFNPDYNF